MVDHPVCDVDVVAKQYLDIRRSTGQLRGQSLGNQGGDVEYFTFYLVNLQVSTQRAIKKQKMENENTKVLPKLFVNIDHIRRLIFP